LSSNFHSQASSTLDSGVGCGSKCSFNPFKQNLTGTSALAHFNTGDARGIDAEARFGNSDSGSAKAPPWILDLSVGLPFLLPIHLNAVSPHEMIALPT
jgi:hypothetical protein